MKTIGLILGLLLSYGSLSAQEQEEQGVTVKVVIENVLRDGGHILGSLHSKETWMRGAGVVAAKAEGKKGKAILTFENVTPGTYAIMVIHDENDNNSMDFDTSGMPKEHYGMTGNDMVMGPPIFESAKFEVTDKDQEFSIRF